MVLYFITGNAHKAAEVQAIIPEVEQLDIDLTEIQGLNPHAIIQHKLAAAFAHHKGPFLVEDTSLHLRAWNGFPGPLVKWLYEADGNEGIHDLAAARADNHATARTIIGYAASPQDTIFFEGTLEGKIIAARGDKGFGWDPVFLPQDSKLTLGEMSAAQKNAFSMRRIALEKLAAYLKTQKG